MRSNEIEKRKKKNPHDVDEMPIKAGKLDGRVVERREFSPPGLKQQNDQNGDSDDHVNGVHAGHGKVK
jgi:hypothetical protein